MADSRMLLIFAFLLAVVSSQPGPAGPFVNTNLGLIRGTWIDFEPRYLRQTGEVRAYLGIPYAKPPVGERRFRPPEPVEPWQGIRNANVNSPACPQIRLLEPYYQMSEDCLYLNVFVPATAPANANVMVFIHGGTLITGSGHDFPYNPVPLATLNDVIVVTLNYRLNIFGFFTTGDDEIPANLGLRDQRLALRWVNENIAAFGGDPEKVTLFGESAGGVSVGWHVVTDESRQYFQRAIIQSGSPYNPFAKVLTEDEVGEALLFISEIGGCLPPIPGDTRYIADCLGGKSIEELLIIHGTVDHILQGAPIWVPANDRDFFPSDAYESIPNGDYSGLDVIIGTNEDEGTYDVYISTGFSYTPPNITREQFSNLTVQTDDPLISGLVAAVYADGIEDGNYLDALSTALGDKTFTCGANEFARQIAKAGATVFMYRMTVAPARNLLNATWLGASHADDLQYVFGLPFQDHPLFKPSYRDLKFSYYIMQLWANFAKSGNPNELFRRLGAPEWPEFSSDSEMYKELDLKFSNRRKLRQYRCNFWDRLLGDVIGLGLHYLATAGEGQ